MRNDEEASNDPATKNNRIGSFSLKVTSEDQTLCAFMKPLRKNRLFEYVISEGKRQRIVEKSMIDHSSSIISYFIINNTTQEELAFK